MGKIEDYQQAWVTRLPKSRLVQVAAGGFETVETFAKSLPKDAFTRTVVKTRHGEERIYWCFCKNMMLKQWHKKKRVVISYDNENLDGEPIYLISNKTNWVQAHKIVQIYTLCVIRSSISFVTRNKNSASRTISNGWKYRFSNIGNSPSLRILSYWEFCQFRRKVDLEFV